MFVELFCRSHYSFLRGASSPEEIVSEAKKRGYDAIGISDRNGVYGLPKAYDQARKDGIKLICGAELAITGGEASLRFIPKSRNAYGKMCRIITQAHQGKEKGQAGLSIQEALEYFQKHHSNEFFCAPFNWPESHNACLGDLKDFFQERLIFPISRHHGRHDKRQIEMQIARSVRFGARLVATNDVHFHAPTRQRVQDVLSATRCLEPLNRMGKHVFSNAERFLKSAREMEALFADFPAALQLSREIADSCVFNMRELKYRYPSEWIPSHHTALSYLRELVEKGALTRYPAGIPQDVARQIEHELCLIAELEFSDYFLTIWEIVEFARTRKILCQGRGSAANSVVCYCLGITAVDPVRMNLLFERFLSAERCEPPDIDVDFQNDRREEVIQHIYEKYGRDRAAMVSAVITYRSRSAIRDVARALDLDLIAAKNNEFALTLADEMLTIPRHLSIHSGGFTLGADPLVEIVPVEPARMEGRTIVQWDKRDLEILGLVKIDVLALGMLSAIHRTLDLIPDLSFASIPAEDSATYEMIRAADTVGVFQIESRAQMQMLPRLLPKTYYDLVVQVAIVRPGPIVGKMVHPYLRRRKGLEPLDIPHPTLVPILERTLGVPLFQEQIMRIAVALAGFTPGEADELRRSIGAWRSSGSVEKVGTRLRTGLLAQGLPLEFVNRTFEQIRGFAEYGFPESHAASFALIAYVSCYLKCHYPAEFLCGLLNSQPMGFYSMHTLIDDARRHDVKILPVDPEVSEWETTLNKDRAVRLGWRMVRGFREHTFREIKEARPFQSLEDFLSRTPMSLGMAEAIAMASGFSNWEPQPRDALWRVMRWHSQFIPERDGQLSLFQNFTSPEITGARFLTLTDGEKVRRDYSLYHSSLRGHPIEVLRRTDKTLPKMTTAQARATANEERIEIAGLSIVRQRPPTAKGTVFMTLEDESGFLDLILWASVYEKFRTIVKEHAFIVVKGKIQREGQAANLIVSSLRPVFDDKLSVRSLSANTAR